MDTSDWLTTVGVTTYLFGNVWIATADRVVDCETEREEKKEVRRRWRSVC